MKSFKQIKLTISDYKDKLVLESKILFYMILCCFSKKYTDKYNKCIFDYWQFYTAEGRIELARKMVQPLLRPLLFSDLDRYLSERYAEPISTIGLNITSISHSTPLNYEFTTTSNGGEEITWYSNSKQLIPIKRFEQEENALYDYLFFYAEYKRNLELEKFRNAIPQNAISCLEI